MNPLVKNLKKQLTCSICFDTYNEPKTISCLHTFCCQCLERHARVVSQRQGKFRCPECQAEINLPEGNRFDRLPNSFFHKSLLGVIEAEDRQAIPRQQQGTCSQHTEERVRYYCSSCEVYVCPICVTEDHRGHAFDVLEKAVQEGKKSIMSAVFDRLPNSFFHKSLLGVLEAEDCQAISRQQQETCLQHTEERLRYYCSTCEASVCPVCVTEDHRGHAFDLLEKAVQEEKKNIMSTVETIKEKADLFRAELRKLEKTSEDVEMIIAIAKQEVSEATERVITKTRQQEKQLLES